jgi:transcriptional regulator with XRE-family HTH domain
MALGDTLRRARLERGLSASEVAAATRMKVQIVEGIEREDFAKIAAPIYGKGFIRLYAEKVGVDPAPLIAEYMELLQGDAPTHAPAPAHDTEAPVPPPRPAPRETSLFPSLASAPPAPEAEPEPDAPIEDAPDLEPPAAELPWEEPDTLLHPQRGPGAGARLRARTADAAEAARDWCSRAGAAAGQALRRSAVRLETRFGALRTMRFSETPARYASLLVGIVIVLLFVLSGLSRCTGIPFEDVLAPDAAEENLELVIDPPMPYLD